MKINTSKNRLLCYGVALSMLGLLLVATPATARVIDTNPVTDQRWIISEIFLGTNNYKGAYIELYNNDDHTALGYKDFLINLPFDVDLPPIFDLRTYKPHSYKQLPLDEGWSGWLAKKYLQIMYGDDVFYEIEDALGEQSTYSYQRCQSTYDDGTRVLSNKFYYGKKTPGKEIECSDKTVTSTNPNDYLAGQCTSLKLNEIGSYLYPEEQFIEIANTGNESVNLSNCYIAKSKSSGAVHAQLEDFELEPGELYSFNVESSELESITKSSGIIYLIDSDDKTVVNYKRYSGAKENSSTALDENGQWKITYKLTPGEPNIIEEYPECPEGQYRDEDTHRCRDLPDEDDKSDQDDEELDENGLKPCKEGYERNPETNRCRKIVYEELDENGLKPCKEGYERNPETNRCRKIVDEEDGGLVPCREGYVRNPETNRCVKIKTDEDKLTPCKEGYERNPETNRCVKIKTAESELTPCKDGYERNPETNRCVKIKTAENKDEDDEAKYPVVLGSTPTTPTDASTISLIIVISIIAVGSLGILLWQYRHEISRWWAKITTQTKSPQPSTAKIKLTDNELDKQSTDEWLNKLSQ